MKKEGTNEGTIVDLADLYEELITGNSIIAFFIGILDFIIPYAAIQLYRYIRDDIDILGISDFKYILLMGGWITLTWIAVILLLITGVLIYFTVIELIWDLREKRIKKRLNKQLSEIKKLISEMVETREFAPNMIFTIGMTCARDLCPNKRDVKAFKKYLISTYKVFEPFDKETNKYGVFKDKKGDKH